MYAEDLRYFLYYFLKSVQFHKKIFLFYFQAFSKDTATFYAGGIADMFATLRVIAIKTIGSSIVDEEELSKFGINCTQKKKKKNGKL